jgi:hypothetical protein
MMEAPEPEKGTIKLSENSLSYPLTRIRNAYTLASTQNASEEENLIITQFINTLAEVALAVASRETNNGGCIR